MEYKNNIILNYLETFVFISLKLLKKSAISLTHFHIICFHDSTVID